MNINKLWLKVLYYDLNLQSQIYFLWRWKTIKSGHYKAKGLHHEHNQRCLGIRLWIILQIGSRGPEPGFCIVVLVVWVRDFGKHAVHSHPYARHQNHPSSSSNITRCTLTFRIEWCADSVIRGKSFLRIFSNELFFYSSVLINNYMECTIQEKGFLKLGSKFSSTSPSPSS